MGDQRLPADMARKLLDRDIATRERDVLQTKPGASKFVVSKITALYVDPCAASTVRTLTF